jgi:signal peptidase I
MAPTLLGQHLLIHSDQTGMDFAVGMDSSAAPRPAESVGGRLIDPMLGPNFRGSAVTDQVLRKRMGDRILVLKCLYPFTEPKRFDVVVFKNPTDPIGDAANYIKRLVGLPNEHIWLVDGDVFARPYFADQPDKNEAEFKIQRKPEHVQRAVWQMVHHSDHVPSDPNQLSETTGRRYSGPPWRGASWDTSGRAYVCTDAAPSMLTWDNSERRISDWTPYNMLDPRQIRFYAVSDVRVSAGIEAQKPGLTTKLELAARQHVFEFILEHSSSDPQKGKATLQMRAPGPDPGSGGGRVIHVREADIDWPVEPGSGEVFNVEFWHVDQSMQMFINGEPALEPLNYEWTGDERLRFAADEDEDEDDFQPGPSSPASQWPRLQWHFEGSPLTLHRVRVDRDLFYRPDKLFDPRQQRNGPPISGHAFATSRDDKNKGRLGPVHYMMCGDNSQMSLDSRLWGRPHPLVAQQIDPAPFVVNRKLLLGKAWVVYFPAPFPVTDGGRVPVIPDFGRLRFIR